MGLFNHYLATDRFMGLTLSNIRRNLLLPKETQGGSNYPPVRRVSSFMGPMSPVLNRVGVHLVYSLAHRSLFIFAKQTQGGAMPKQHLTQKQASNFDLLLSTIPVVHIELRKANIITVAESNRFFQFYTMVERIHERLGERV